MPKPSRGGQRGILFQRSSPIPPPPAQQPPQPALDEEEDVVAEEETKSPTPQQDQDEDQQQPAVNHDDIDWDNTQFPELTKSEYDQVYQDNRDSYKKNGNIVNAKKMYESANAKPTRDTVGNQPNKSYSQDMNHRLNNDIPLDSDSKFMAKYLTQGLHPIGTPCTLKRGAHDTVVNQLLKKAGYNTTYDKMSVQQLNAALKGSEFSMKSFGSFGANDRVNPFIGGSQGGGREIIMIARTAGSTKVIAGARAQQEFITGIGQRAKITGFKATNQMAYPQMGGMKPVVEMYIDLW